MSLVQSARVERKRQLDNARETIQSLDVAALTFVVMAQTDMIDDVTITENSDLFPIWDQNWTGKAGAIVQDEEKLYKSIHNVGAGQNTKPSITPSMWTRIGNPAEEYPEWSAPYGAHDAYLAEAKVTHKGFKWRNTHGNGNIWEPGVYGWEKVL